MGNRTPFFALLGPMSALVLLAAPAHAQASRTWVSGLGDDANACSLSAPCKTFAGAISKTAAGGEIDCFDRGGFGAVTITKAITIDCSGTFGSALAAGLSGVIIVNAGAGDKVLLRGISINGLGTSLTGIRFLIGAQLSVENCLISGFTGSGIDINVTSNAEVFITNTYITKASTGIRAVTSASLSVAVNNVTVAGPTTHGFEAASMGVAGTIANTVIARAGGSGVIASAEGAEINVDSSTLASNLTAFNASVGKTTIRVSNNNIYNNGTNFNIAEGATIETNNTNRTTAGGATNPNGTIVQR
jgi:hypothetical protein